MAFYNLSNLENDFDYIVNSYTDIQKRELHYIENNKLSVRKKNCLDVLQHQKFSDLIKLMGNFFPKTFNLLIMKNPQIQVAFKFYDEDDIVFYPFIAVKNRVYWITLPAYSVGNIRESISHGICSKLGGLFCTDTLTPIWGQTLISEPTSWQSFDDYLGKRNTKKVIQAIVSRIPYAYEEENVDSPQKYKVKGFPNLRVFLDSREPGEKQTEYDLLLTCYDYDQNIYWVKNGNFENELYILSNPETAIDEYMVHVFSQAEGRFDFSPWSTKLEPNLTMFENVVFEPEIEEEEWPAIPLLDPELSAKLGHIPAQIKLGVDYCLGQNGFEKNIERGHYWFWQAAKSGNVLAQYNWASYWCKQPKYTNTNFSDTQLLEWHKEGDLAATYMLGVYSEIGSDLISKSYTKAVEYYQYAADQNFAPAINNLADKYENGLGVEQNFEKAFELYKIAANANIAAAQWSLALMYLEGKPIAKDKEVAKQWLIKAQENGWDTAKELLEKLGE